MWGRSPTCRFRITDDYSLAGRGPAPRAVHCRIMLRFASVILLGAVAAAAPPEKGFVALFNGRDLTGWQIVGQHGPGYLVKDGVLYCPSDGGGNLFTEKEYANFVFRFEFKLEEGSNNGVGIRAPLAGDTAYSGMEIQIL